MSKKSIAFHEAGHAVALYFQGLRFESVSIISSDTYAGIVRHDGYDGKNRKLIRKHVVVGFAGELAERISGYREWDNMFSDTEGYDLLDLEKLSAQAYKTIERQREFLAEVRQEAIELVLSPEWTTAIKALASALLKAKELDYSQTIAIIRQSQIGE